MQYYNNSVVLYLVRPRLRQKLLLKMLIFNGKLGISTFVNVLQSSVNFAVILH